MYASKEVVMVAVSENEFVSRKITSVHDDDATDLSGGGHGQRIFWSIINNC